MAKLSKETRTLTWDRKLIYPLILALALIGLLGRGLYFDKLQTELNIQLTIFSVFVLIALYEFFSFVNRRLKRLFPLDKVPIPRVVIQLSVGSLFLFGVRWLGIYWMGDYFPVEFNWAFKAAIYVVDFFVTASVNAIFFISEYIEKWKKSIQRAERLEKEKAQVQFDNLKNQLNPHFLFNALTSLNSLIKTDQELASEFLQNMSRVYRYVLQHKDRDVVRLEEENNFIQDYLFLMQTRFGKAFIYKDEMDAEAMDKGIVPVTLQILMENALKHNTISNKNPLTIRVYVKDDHLFMENNYQPKNRVEGSNKVGLENLKSLYQYLSNDSVHWEVEGGVFRIQIPLIER